MYLIRDNQNGGYFADGAKFKTKKAVREQLLSYHGVDLHSSDDREAGLVIDLRKLTLDDLLEIGDWTLERAFELVSVR